MPTTSVGDLKNGSYYESRTTTPVNSPRADLARPPYCYHRWNNYSVAWHSNLGWLGDFCRDAALTIPLSRPFSSWEQGFRVNSITPSYPPTSDVLASLVSRWKSSDLNLGVSLVEGRESIDLITNKLGGILQSARALRRGNIGAAIRSLSGKVPRSHRRRASKRLKQGDVSGSWLALHLGWVPMVNDIYAASEFIRTNPKIDKVSSSWRKGTVAVSTYASSIMPISVKSRDCRMRYVVKLKSSATVAERLGLQNPAAIAWEVIPFSFVVDYFLPIGDVIESLSAFSIDYSECFLEKRYDVKVYMPPVPKGHKYTANVMYARTGLPACRNRQRSYSRTKVSVASQVAASVKMRVPTSFTRLANMAALVHQSLLKMRK